MSSTKDLLVIIIIGLFPRFYPRHFQKVMLANAPIKTALIEIFLFRCSSLYQKNISDNDH
jgi:hypothetical protein